MNNLQTIWTRCIPYHWMTFKIIIKWVLVSSECKMPTKIFARWKGEIILAFSLHNFWRLSYDPEAVFITSKIWFLRILHYWKQYIHTLYLRNRYMYVMMTMKIIKLIVDFEIYCHLNEYLQHADSCCSIKSQWNSLDKTLWIFFIVVAFSQLWRRVVAKKIAGL